MLAVKLQSVPNKKKVVPGFYIGQTFDVDDDGAHSSVEYGAMYPVESSFGPPPGTP
jgi:hypothetical protein